MTAFVVLGGIVLLAAVFLAVDYVVAGRKGGGILGRLRSTQRGNDAANEAIIERQSPLHGGGSL